MTVINIDGGFNCSCEEGFVLANDSNSCIGTFSEYVMSVLCG